MENKKKLLVLLTFTGLYFISSKNVILIKTKQRESKKLKALL
jgi:hypothetical protein